MNPWLDILRHDNEGSLEIQDLFSDREIDALILAFSAKNPDRDTETGEEMFLREERLCRLLERAAAHRLRGTQLDLAIRGLYDLDWVENEIVFIRKIGKVDV